MAKRYPHFIHKTKGQSYPRTICCIECSSKLERTHDKRITETETLYCWSARVCTLKDGKPQQQKVFTGDTVQEWRNTLLSFISVSGVTWIYCYSGSRILSMLRVWNDLEDGTLALSGYDPARDSSSDKPDKKNQTGYAVLEDPPIILLCKWRGRPGMLKWIDIRNYGLTERSNIFIPGSLSSADDPGNNGKRLEAIQWCTARAERMLRFVLGMIECLKTNDLGSLQSTAGSQSTYSWKHSHLTHTAYVHCKHAALDLERKSLHGGRCEVFRMGKAQERIVQLDFRSLYPSCCVNERLPCLLRDYVVNPSLDTLKTSVTKYQCIANVVLNVDMPIVPTKVKGNIIWPIGKFPTVLCGPELDIAIANDYVVSCAELSTYDSAPLLHEFAMKWHDLRCQFDDSKDKALSAWCKQILVGIVGKLAQRSKIWKDMPNVPAPRPYFSEFGPDGKGGVTRWRYIAWHSQMEVDEGEHPESIPSVSAWILSLARCKLLKALLSAGLSNCYYCDTDSVWTNENGFNRLVKDDMIGERVLGKLQIVDWYDSCAFLGWKHYVAGNTVKCAGIPKGDAEFIPDSNQYWYRTWLGDALFHGKSPSAMREIRTAERIGEYKLGVITPDGRVKPWKLGINSNGEYVLF